MNHKFLLKFFIHTAILWGVAPITAPAHASQSLIAQLQQQRARADAQQQAQTQGQIQAQELQRQQALLLIQQQDQELKRQQAIEQEALLLAQQQEVWRKQHLQQQVLKLQQEQQKQLKPNPIHLEENLLIRANKIKEIIALDQNTYGSNSLYHGLSLPIIERMIFEKPNKIDTEILLLAMGASNEEYTVINNFTRIEHALRIYTRYYSGASNNEEIKANYTKACQARGHIYTYIEVIGKDPSHNDVFEEAEYSIREAVGKHPNDLDLLSSAIYSFSLATPVAIFQYQFKKDLEDLTTRFTKKQTELLGILQKSQYNIMANETHLPLLQEWQDSFLAIDEIERTKVTNPFYLHYARLTYQDFAAALFEIEYPPLTEEVKKKFTDIRDELINLIKDEDFQYNGLGLKLNSREYNKSAQKYKNDITYRFNEILKNPKDYWIERIINLYEKAPDTEINPSIARPNTESFNPLQWVTELNTAKKLIGQHIVGAIYGCDSGKNMKLGKIEDRYQEALGNRAIKIKVIKPIEMILRTFKNSKINELGNRPDPNSIHYEEKITTPIIAKQRLRGPLGLGGDFENIAAGGLGNPRDAQNCPIQIIKNMFVANQPARVYGDQNSVTVSVSAPLTVSSLVKAVYEEFDHSIPVEYINQFCSGNLSMLKDLSWVTDSMKDGVFNKYTRDTTARSKYTLATAFCMLETFEYIKIQPHIKEVLYTCDSMTEEARTIYISHLSQEKSLQMLLEEDVF